jgi:cbb3-type cytochrome oxidase maturation protein
MDAATIALTIMTGAIGLVFLGFLIWALKSGQFHNVEEAKYQVFRKQKPPGGDTTNSRRKGVEDHAEP